MQNMSKNNGWANKGLTDKGWADYAKDKDLSSIKPIKSKLAHFILICFALYFWVGFIFILLAQQEVFDFRDYIKGNSPLVPFIICPFIFSIILGPLKMLSLFKTTLVEVFPTSIIISKFGQQTKIKQHEIRGYYISRHESWMNNTNQAHLYNNLEWLVFDTTQGKIKIQSSGILNFDQLKRFVKAHFPDLE